MKTDLFDNIEDDIFETYSETEEIDKIKKIISVAKEQSKLKKINITREVNELNKFLILWKNRWKYGLHKKPGYELRIIKNVLLGKTYYMLGYKKYVLRGIEFACTFKCIFRCNHCLCARIDETNKRKELEPKDYSRVVKEAMALGATTFGLEGGEPFVKKNWDEIINSWQPHYNHIIISTNGYLFDEEKAKRCAELGVDTINFSLDSGYSELHDTFRRKKGSFDRVINAIKLSKKHGIKPLINTVVHKGNLYTDGWRELLEFTHREGILINTLFAKGMGNFYDKDALLDEEDLKAYKKIVAPYPNVQRHLNFNYGKQFGCPGMKEMINMTPYGDVMNCANMHIYFGNVLEEPLAVIRERALKKSPFGRYHCCFLAEDRDFMNVYYPILSEKRKGEGYMRIEEFLSSLKEYENKNNKILYPELRYH
ncbi:MAG: radical SAM protein [Desulfobacterales bacterium]|nr:radical SAM protein [Desulfobacterales bacterium]